MKKLVLIFLLLIPTLTISSLAYNLNVNCQDSVQINSHLTCNIVLNQPVASTFGDQFVINAQGFTAAANFIQGVNNVTASSGGLGRQTVLIENDYRTNRGQTAGNVAVFNLTAPAAAGSYTVSLTNLVIASGTQNDTIIVTSPQTAAATTDSGSSSSSSSGGGGGGGGSGSRRSSRIISNRTTSGETALPTERPGQVVAPTTNEFAAEEVETDQTKDLAPETSEPNLWWWAVIGGLIVVGLVGLVAVLLYYKRNW